MRQEPDNCPEHAWASIGVTVIDGTVHRIWDCERCSAWTTESLSDDRHIPWAETDLSP
jgi:hypothetical protein